MAEITQIEHNLKNGKTIIIRHGVEDDASALLACAKAYISEGPGMVLLPGEFNLTENQEREWIKAMRQDPNELLLVAHASGQDAQRNATRDAITIVGNLDFNIGKKQRFAHTGEFGMGVIREWQGQGLGTLLIKTFLDWATSNARIEKLNLNVLASNYRAIGLYRKFGFMEEGRQVREIKYENGSYEDNILMTKRLR